MLLVLPCCFCSFHLASSPLPWELNGQFQTGTLVEKSTAVIGVHSGKWWDYGRLENSCKQVAYYVCDDGVWDVLLGGCAIKSKL